MVRAISVRPRAVHLALTAWMRWSSATEKVRPLKLRGWVICGGGMRALQ
jgi:hypothetical protein